MGSSIAQVLYLLIHTRYGELRSDFTFGCRIWDHEFDGYLSQQNWSQYLTDSLLEAIRNHEPRLSQVDVSLQFLPVANLVGHAKTEDYRKGVIILVTAIIRQTEEPFRFTTKLYIGQFAAH